MRQRRQRHTLDGPATGGNDGAGTAPGFLGGNGGNGSNGTAQGFGAGTGGNGGKGGNSGAFNTGREGEDGGNATAPDGAANGGSGGRGTGEPAGCPAGVPAVQAVQAGMAARRTAEPAPTAERSARFGGRDHCGGDEGPTGRPPSTATGGGRTGSTGGQAPRSSRDVDTAISA